MINHRRKMSKKGQMLIAFTVVSFIIGFSVALIAKTNMLKNEDLTKLGVVQTDLEAVFVSGEKAIGFIDKAREYSLARSLVDLSNAGGLLMGADKRPCGAYLYNNLLTREKNCLPEDHDVLCETIKSRFELQFSQYLRKYPEISIPEDVIAINIICPEGRIYAESSETTSIDSSKTKTTKEVIRMIEEKDADASKDILDSKSKIFGIPTMDTIEIIGDKEPDQEPDFEFDNEITYEQMPPAPPYEEEEYPEFDYDWSIDYEEIPQQEPPPDEEVPDDTTIQPAQQGQCPATNYPVPEEPSAVWKYQSKSCCPISNSIDFSQVKKESELYFQSSTINDYSKRLGTRESFISRLKLMKSSVEKLYSETGNVPDEFVLAILRTEMPADTLKYADCTLSLRTVKLSDQPQDVQTLFNQLVEAKNARKQAQQNQNQDEVNRLTAQINTFTSQIESKGYEVIEETKDDVTSTILKKWFPVTCGLFQMQSSACEDVDKNGLGGCTFPDTVKSSDYNEQFRVAAEYMKISKTYVKTLTEKDETDESFYYFVALSYNAGSGFVQYLFNDMMQLKDENGAPRFSKKSDIQWSDVRFEQVKSTANNMATVKPASYSFYASLNKQKEIFNYPNFVMYSMAEMCDFSVDELAANTAGSAHDIMPRITQDTGMQAETEQAQIYSSSDKSLLSNLAGMGIFSKIFGKEEKKPEPKPSEISMFDLERFSSQAQVFGSELQEWASSYNEYLQNTDLSYHDSMLWPVGDEPRIITSCWGWRTLGSTKDFHDGIDIRSAEPITQKVVDGRPVLAALKGEVHSVCYKWVDECACTIANINSEQKCNPEDNCKGKCGNFGNTIVLKHSDNLFTRYSHLSWIDPDIISGKKKIVDKGEKFAETGNTGNSGGAHLDFKVYLTEDYRSIKEPGVNPLCFFSEETLNNAGIALSADSCADNYNINDKGSFRFSKQNTGLKDECEKIKKDYPEASIPFLNQPVGVVVVKQPQARPAVPASSFDRFLPITSYGFASTSQDTDTGRSESITGIVPEPAMCTYPPKYPVEMIPSDSWQFYGCCQFSDKIDFNMIKKESELEFGSSQSYAGRLGTREKFVDKLKLMKDTVKKLYLEDNPVPDEFVLGILRTEMPSNPSRYSTCTPSCKTILDGNKKPVVDAAGNPVQECVPNTCGLFQIQKMACEDIQKKGSGCVFPDDPQSKDFDVQFRLAKDYIKIVEDYMDVNSPKFNGKYLDKNSESYYYFIALSYNAGHGFTKMLLNDAAAHYGFSSTREVNWSHITRELVAKTAERAAPSVGDYIKQPTKIDEMLNYPNFVMYSMAELCGFSPSELDGGMSPAEEAIAKASQPTTQDAEAIEDDNNENLAGAATKKPAIQNLAGEAGSATGDPASQSAGVDYNLLWPVSDQPGFVTSCWGWRDRSGADYHDGIDIKSSAYPDPTANPVGGREVLAAARGEVYSICYEWIGDCACSVAHDAALNEKCAPEANCNGKCGNYGNTIVLKHTNNLFTRYSHLSSIEPDIISGKKKTVEKGEKIAKTGNTGSSEAAHLDFKVYLRPDFASKRESGVNPLCFFSEETINSVGITETANSCDLIYGIPESNWRTFRFTRQHPVLKAECEKIKNEYPNAYIPYFEDPGTIDGYDTITTPEEPGDDGYSGNLVSDAIGGYKIDISFESEMEFSLRAFDDLKQFVLTLNKTCENSYAEDLAGCVESAVKTYNGYGPYRSGQYSAGIIEGAAGCEDSFVYPFLEAYYDCLMLNDDDCICEYQLTAEQKQNLDGKYIRVSDSKLELRQKKTLAKDRVIAEFILPFNPAYFKNKPDDKGFKGGTKELFKDRDTAALMYKTSFVDGKSSIILVGKQDSKRQCIGEKSAFMFCAETGNILPQERYITTGEDTKDEKRERVYTHSTTPIKFAVDLSRIYYEFEDLKLFVTSDRKIAYFLWSNPNPEEVRMLNAYFSSQQFSGMTADQLDAMKKSGTLSVSEIANYKLINLTYSMESIVKSSKLETADDFSAFLTKLNRLDLITVYSTGRPVILRFTDGEYIMIALTPDIQGADNYIALTTTSKKGKELPIPDTQGSSNYWSGDAVLRMQDPQAGAGP